MIYYYEYEKKEIENAPLFRNRNCRFWRREFYKEGKWLDTASIPDDLKYLVIFNPELFLPLSYDDILSIVEQAEEIRTSCQNETHLFTLPAMAMFIIPEKTLRVFQKDHSFNFTETDPIPQLISMLSANDFMSSFTLGCKLRPLKIESDLRKIEAAICGYQIIQFRQNGVTIEDFNNFYIEGNIRIGKGSRIASGVVLKGNTEIGSNVIIHPHACLDNARIGDNCEIFAGSIITDSAIESNVKVGPYAHLRMNALIKEGAKMGNFVEMKNSVLGKGSKAMHLTYLGDAQIGEKANIGAGTVTCNYDGVNKNKTVIGDGVFIGSGSMLVAPVTIHKEGYVGAGSTITDDVPEYSLALARQRQRNVLNWVLKKREKQKTQSEKH